MKNIVLITIDSLRNDFIGNNISAFNDGTLTPNINKWSSNAFEFSNAISTGPSTGLSFPSLLSGIYYSSYKEKFGLSSKRKMVAEILKEFGFTTCGFHSNPYLTSNFNYHRGFDDYFDNFVGESTGVMKSKIKIAFKKIQTIINEPYWKASEINVPVLEWLKKEKNNPFFLWCHYMDVHGPYISKTGFKLFNRIKSGFLWEKATKNPGKVSGKEKSLLIELYKEEIRYLDHHINEVIRSIPSDTIVILTADHGEYFSEKGLYSHPGILYEPVLKVPLYIKLPEDYNLRPRAIPVPVSTLDIIPTICDLLKIPTKVKFDGVSLLNLMEDEKEKYGKDYIISETGSVNMCIRKNEWKLIANYQTNAFELYNLAEDPNEVNNLTSQKDNIFNELNSILKDHRSKMILRQEESLDTDQTDTVSDNAEIQSRLKQLGYM